MENNQSNSENSSNDVTNQVVIDIENKCNAFKAAYKEVMQECIDDQEIEDNEYNLELMELCEEYYKNRILLEDKSNKM